MCPERESNPQTLGFKPSRSASLAYLGKSGPGWSRTIVSWVWTKCRCRWTTGPCFSSGVTGSRTRHRREVGRPACGAGVVLLDHDPNVFSSQRKPWGSNPQAACLPPPAFQAGSSTVRMASVITPAKAEAVGLEPTNGFSPSPVFRTGSSSGRMASVVKLRRLELNQHEDLQRVSSYR